MEELNEFKIEILSKFLGENDFEGAKKIIDVIILHINKNNFENELKVIKESLDEGRKSRQVDFEPKEGREKLISLYTDSDKPEIKTVDKEAMLIVYIAKKIYEVLELDNTYLNKENEIEDMMSILDNFVNSYALGFWFENDNNWKERKI